MRYATAAAFRRALDTRLAEHARRTRLPLVRLRRMVVFERLLARLMLAAPDRWVLKGGLALDILTTSNLLAFAGIEPFAVPAMPLAQHVAEKLHAYTRTYGEEGVSSTRVKDLIDLVLIASTESVDANDLRQALEWIFGSRGTHPLPAALPPPPASWAVPYAKLAAEVGIDQDVLAGHSAAARFLDQILSGASASGKRWNPKTNQWFSNA